MPRLIWSPEALADVQRLYRFLVDKNPDAARRAASAIRDGMQIIADHPDAGRPVDDMDPEFREWPISFGASGYVALYHLQQDVALVVAVRHQKEVGHQPL
ncbi:type II toxin-antitoxin system RelE/ParE family toxin [uncultured Sulfitobacter sp.]|uniref:type II toxin-antitoxin system RelE/ParE family toxin n=1 Tax=uncultured Sulfitobacter sp. TaxID=191468 RepID=UPI002607D189|nr:type II toxin-antitoxin system RelE/ParE family toxin [uncultured Sulfitobacter sp.]